MDLEARKSVGRKVAMKLNKAGRSGGRPDIITAATTLLCNAKFEEALDVLREAGLHHIPALENVMYDIDEWIVSFDQTPKMTAEEAKAQHEFLTDLKKL